MKRNLSVIRQLFAAVLVSSTLFAPISAYAAPKVMPNGETFDAEYYAQQNPDVVAAFGTDENALYNHYEKYGKAEGRLPYQIQVRLTDDQIRAKAYAMQTTYPEGMTWGPYHCGYFAQLIRFAVFGNGNENCHQYVNTSGEREEVSSYCTECPLTFDDIQVGDTVEYTGAGTPDHVVFVLDKTRTSITVCEGSYNAIVHWGRTLYKQGCGDGRQEEILTVNKIIRAKSQIN